MNTLRTILFLLVTLVPACAGPTLLIPCYDTSYAGKIVEIAQQSHVAVIVNVNDGPGDKLDKEWLKIIRNLRATKAEVYGYIDLVQWAGNKSTPRTGREVRLDAQRWAMLYEVDAYFYDDWQERTTREIVAPNRSIANPSSPEATTCRTTLIWETAGYTKSKPSKIKSTAVFAMGEADYRPALRKAIADNVSYFYAVTAGDTWQAYDKLPIYLKALANDLKK